MIKIYKYFFDDKYINEFAPQKIVQGETRRSIGGKAHTTIISDPTNETNDDIGYYRFNIELNGLKYRQVSFLEEIKMKVINGDIEDFELMTPWGETYDVFIPLPSEEHFDITGESGNFMANLVLEERG